jgi:hypothetical protein
MDRASGIVKDGRTAYIRVAVYVTTSAIEFMQFEQETVYPLQFIEDYTECYGSLHSSITASFLESISS